MKLNKNKTQHIFILAILIVSITILSVAYAAFSSEFTISGEAYVYGNNNIKITNISLADSSDEAYEKYNTEYTTESISVYLTMPNEESSITYTIEVKNGTDSTYYISQVFESIFDNENISYEIVNAESVKLTANTTTSFDIIFYYNSYDSENTDLTAELYILFLQKNYLSDVILVSNAFDETGEVKTVEESIDFIENKIEPDFSATATTDEGMYAVEDEAGTSYYFRGDIKDNYVYFAGYYWQIIRIDGNGDIKLIYAGETIEYDEEDGLTLIDQSIGTSKFNNVSGNSVYAGYVYELENLHGTTSDSAIKTIVDEWFNQNLYSDDYIEYLTESTYCIDRSAWSEFEFVNEVYDYQEGFIIYGAYYRTRSNKIPSLKCQYEVDNVELYAGLISADEASFAGLVTSINNQDNYLYTGSSFWTISPSLYNGSSAYGIPITENGSIALDKSNDDNVVQDYDVRPTITLDSSVLYSSGEGTIDDPYTVLKYEEEVKEEVYQLSESTQTVLLSTASNETGEEMTLEETLEYYESKGVPDTYYTVAKTDEGIFATSDDYGTTYYYRGAVDYNWIYWAGYYWRIIRIDGDGNIRLIYSGDVAPTEDESIVMSADSTYISKSKFNDSTSDPVYVGYQYELENLNGYGENATDSTVKTVLDTWYEQNLLGTIYENDIADVIYCNDRTMYTSMTVYSGGTTIESYYDWNLGYNTESVISTYFASLNRINTDTTSFVCSNYADQFTVSSENGNGALDYPIGLITGDEYDLAGGERFVDNFYFYLYTGYEYWTMSPSSFWTGSSLMSRISTTGGVNGAGVTGNIAVRPVIALDSSNITLTGSGTWDDPFLVNEEEPAAATTIVNSVYDETGEVMTEEEALSYYENKEEESFKGYAVEAGMYAAEDDYGYSYYYRGNVDNNYVEFAGYTWRIVRIDGLGNIRLASDDVLFYSKFNEYSDSAEYMGYMYTLGETNGLSESSTIKLAIDDWYEENILNEGYSKYVADVVYCGDRTVVGTGSWTNSITESTYEKWTSGIVGVGLSTSYYQYYGARIRTAAEFSPSYSCTNIADAYTVSSEIGNGELVYPVGLLSGDEISYAGLYAYNTPSETVSYLQSNISYWTMSPSVVGTTEVYIQLVSSSGQFYREYSSASRGVVVSLALSVDTVFIGGTGTEDDPYVVDYN